jgi:hypothetical protein
MGAALLGGATGADGCRTVGGAAGGVRAGSAGNGFCNCW